ncbi:MAG: sigma 54-interacting transcriptional regulator [Planctomycetota bacterium]
MNISDPFAELEKLLVSIREQEGPSGLERAAKILGDFRRESRVPAEAKPSASDESLTDENGLYRNRIIGRSPKMLALYRMMEKVLPTAYPVLIHGESGTGKELVAKAIHEGGPRAKKPFVAENCAAIPETLLESELFGYKKGAFTGADRDKLGMFQVADGGTVFLDEIGDMGSSMQTKLLRTLQSGEIRPVGGKSNQIVDVRVIAASNKDLKKLIQTGEFREDLYYRIAVLPLELPPLRERGDDILLLAEAFLERFSKQMSLERPELAQSAKEALSDYRWPGNVRELENEMQRALALAGPKIEAEDLSDALRAG